MDPIFIGLGHHLLLGPSALDEHVHVAAHLLRRPGSVCVRRGFDRHHDNVTTGVGDPATEPEVVADLDWLLEVDVSQVLDVELLMLSKPGGRNPARLDHFPHEEPPEYFVVQVPLLDVHQVRVADHSVLDLHVLLQLVLLGVEEDVVDDLGILGGGRHVPVRLFYLLFATLHVLLGQVLSVGSLA